MANKKLDAEPAIIFNSKNKKLILNSLNKLLINNY